LWYTKEPLFIIRVKHNFEKQDEQADTTNPYRSDHFEITGKGVDVQRNGGYAKCKHQYYKKALQKYL
jgi:hypothetical protein